MTNIYIVRHGETDSNVAHLIQGHTDTPLNENGRAQARAIKDKIASLKIDVCFCSPLSRARETASIIFDGDVIADGRLIERCCGELEGKSAEEVKSITADWHKMSENIPGGVEGVTSILKRAGEFLEEVKTRYKNKNILAVSHAGIIRAMQAYIDGMPDSGDLYEIPRIDNCEILSYRLR
jgi:probable phosphoglycerate mutase